MFSDRNYLTFISSDRWTEIACCLSLPEIKTFDQQLISIVHNLHFQERAIDNAYYDSKGHMYWLHILTSVWIFIQVIKCLEWHHRVLTKISWSYYTGQINKVMFTEISQSLAYLSQLLGFISYLSMADTTFKYWQIPWDCKIKKLYKILRNLSSKQLLLISLLISICSATDVDTTHWILLD